MQIWFALGSFTTFHRILAGDSRKMDAVSDGSVELVVTSPPYPMIEMWDGLFSSIDPVIGEELAKGNEENVFSRMNSILNLVWKEVSRVLVDGGIACINIGDATRSVNGSFQLFPSHTVISSFFRTIGFQELPSIIWKKPSNSPNKFLGSGTLPVGAYVTLEHEYILIFRKKGKRDFSTDSEKRRRSRSSFFWEERNRWFSDIWDLAGTRQALNNSATRGRSAAFPFEVPYRLINMYSVEGDTVLDPFLGTGTTALAAMTSCRNSIGYDLDKEFSKGVIKRAMESGDFMNSIIEKRISDHRIFVAEEEKRGKTMDHSNQNTGFAVKTKAEKELLLRKIEQIVATGKEGELSVTYG